jgi:hypothetical protein
MERFVAEEQNRTCPSKTSQHLEAVTNDGYFCTVAKGWDFVTKDQLMYGRDISEIA